MGRLTVLIIDDDEECRDLTAEFVRHLGYDEMSVGSGIMAMDKLAASRVDLMSRIDLIISDNMMPGMSGMSFVRKIREKQFTQPLILCSSIFPANMYPVSDQFWS